MEELRTRHKSIQSAAHHIAFECIHPQSAHGSPYHVHPYPSPIRLQHAFDSNPQNNGSPRMFHPKGLKTHFDTRAYSTPNDSPILGRALCLTPKGSPLPGRVSHLSDKFQDSLSLNSDTEALVAKISAMFPTVSETHIKILLKKYYNREAVVISALQVEKHPITTPGPLSMSPLAARLQKGVTAVYSAVQLASSTHGSSHMTPLTGTPHDSPLLRPASGASSYYYGTARSVDGQSTRHQSPKMKLKYIKSIFPKAEETLILDVLANKDNNVQKASEELLTMGFSKKETIVNNPPLKKKEIDFTQPPKKIVTIMKTLEEKNKLKQKLQKKYSSVAERVISIALDSVEYNEERAEQILTAVLQEDSVPKTPKHDDKKSQRPTTDLIKRSLSSSPCPITPISIEYVVSACVETSERRDPPGMTAEIAPRRLKSWTDHLKPILKTSSSVESKYKSRFTMTSKGPNKSHCSGPKDSLLLKNYLDWIGPNPELRTGATVKPEGPEPRERKFSLARGPPPGNAKGPAGLAKGSMYQKLNKKSAKIGSVH